MNYATSLLRAGLVASLLVTGFACDSDPDDPDTNDASVADSTSTPDTVSGDTSVTSDADVDPADVPTGDSAPSDTVDDDSAAMDTVASDSVSDVPSDTQPADTQVADTTEDTVADTTEDTVADTTEDTVVDTAEDAVADTAEDAVADTTEDTVADTAEDTASDVAAETETADGCPTSLYAGTSCLPFLEGCYEPDLGGTCTDTGLQVNWSDGHKIVRAGGGPGLYSPGGASPCITLAFDLGTLTSTLTKVSTGDVLTNKDNGDGTVTITCPGGEVIQTDADGAHADNVCRGVECPD